MKQYQRDFIEFALAQQALKFGSFTLKSGRTSPYFFNTGVFNTGSSLAKLGAFYAAALADSGVDCDLIFGPAYKGIPLVATTAVALFSQHGIDKPYSFNRKEAKDHGEGGTIVGSPLRGRVVVIDDVITAGTAIRESVNIIESAGAKLSGVVISLDRQEKGGGGVTVSAIEQVEKDLGVPVIKIVTLKEVVAYLDERGMAEEAKAIREYWKEYGVGSL